MSLSRERLGLALLGVLIGLVLIDVPWLGVDAWAFVAPDAATGGVLGPLVRAADGQWDLGIVRAPGLLAGVLVAVLALVLPTREPLRRILLIVATVGVVAALLVPATLLQVGLREGTSPWFHTNDAAYQVELAGHRLLHGDNPYGVDYTGTGLERIYSLDGTPVTDGRVETVALQHLAYFPGLPVIGAVSAALPGPLGDVRILMLLFALALIPAALLLPGPLELRLGVGALLAANPLLLRSTWFGILDAPVVLALVLAFALALRGRWGWTGALVALALVEKQYAFVAIPFLALAAWQAGGRAAVVRAGAWLVGVAAVIILPFLAWGPRAFIDDTLVYGTSAYRIVGYGLSGILVDLHVVVRDGSYPFVLLALIIWLPLTLLALHRQRRAPEPWRAALGFALSFLLLAWIARYFQTSGFVYPLAGLLVAAAIALAPTLSKDDA
ncbi:MAG: hypothetical protein ACR2J9_12750 [Gaiellales bacterium]